MITDDLRKKLALALLSAERLYLVFGETSYFDPVPTRPFLDCLWITVLDGKLPGKSSFQKVKKFVKFSAILDEDDCTGIDFYGLSFISCLDILSNTSAWEDGSSLAYLSDEVEINLLDHYLHELFSSGYSLPNASLEARITSDKRMLTLQKQLTDEKIDLASISLDKSSLARLKAKSISNILQ